jgi:exodeoxyribonuclease V gamma subunit
VPSSPTLHVHRSNRAEILVDALARVCEKPLRTPFVPETLVVPGRGMQVWLSQELSRRHGIWSNADFVYPRHFVERALSAVLGELDGDKLVTERELSFFVFGELARQLERPSFEKLARYVSDDASGLKRYKLARRIARVFDQYVTYRPELVRSWERGAQADLEHEAQAWQAELWRALAPRLGDRHVAALELRFLERAHAAAPGEFPELPQRLSVFGVSSLPPLYVRVLASVARHAEVHLFLLSPSPELWWDLPDPRRAERAAVRGAGVGSLHLEAENPLLASLGRLGAEFGLVLASELEALGVAQQESDGLYRAPERRTLLGRVQGDLFELTRGKSDDAPVAAGDQSIVIHSCHGPMREVEVLHDQLLELLGRGTGLKPRDIVVMMPDVEAYAPLVEAVFERERGGDHFIPYRIADRSLRRDSPVIEAFGRVLALVGGRAPASQVLDLLTLEPVRQRFDISTDEVERITEWVVASGIRWGINAEHRNRHAPPGVHEHTWSFGLERLLLGHALRGDDRELFAGRLPFDDVEGGAAELVGRLAELCSRLFRELERLGSARSLARWRDDLVETLEALVAQDRQNAWQHQKLREVLAELAENAAAAGFEEAVNLEVVRALLDDVLDESHPERSFLAGGVTFCAMLPMRSVPFRVVCLLGMSDAAFPRSTQRVDFDLTAGPARRAGDRSRRDDDRYLFLEALLAARDRLIVSYAGQSVRDGSRQPPSVVVSELADYLVRTWGSARSGLAGEDERLAAFHPPLFVRHPLQPFSPRYFDGSDRRLFSYAAAELTAAQSTLGARADPEPLFERALPPLEAAAGSERVLALDELARFVRAPIAYLLNRRLGVVLEDEQLDVPDREPWELDGLETWSVGTLLLELELGGLGDRGYEVARARGVLPPGAVGQALHQRAESAARALAAEVQRRRGTARSESLRVSHRLPSGVRLVGQVGERWAGGRVVYSYSKLSSRHVVSAWVRHLALSALGTNEATYVVARDTQNRAPCVTRRLRPVANADAELEKLCALYQAGQSEPLLLFPEASCAYAKALLEGKAESQALYEARRAFQDERRFDEHVQRVLGESWEPGQPAPFAFPTRASFEELARQVFLPLLSHWESWS